MIEEARGGLRGASLLLSMTTATGTPLVDRLGALGDRYHDHHPFHRALVAGELNVEQVRAWVANRYYYQKMIPVKDSFVLARLPSREHRRAWITRIIDHDGTTAEVCGTAKSIALYSARAPRDDPQLVVHPTFPDR